VPLNSFFFIFNLLYVLNWIAQNGWKPALKTKVFEILITTLLHPHIAQLL